MKKIDNILLLAGGDSTRFWPLNEKILTSFLGRPYIEHILDKITGFADNLFIVVSKENKKAIEQIAVSNTHIIIQPSPTGMGGAVLSCKNKIKGKTLILGNDLFDYSILHILFEKEADMILLAQRVKSYYPGGYLRLKGDKIEAIEEKPDPKKTPSDLVRLVADYLKEINVLISAIESTHSFDDKAYEQALTSIIQNKNATYHRYDDYWYPLKYPWHVLPMMKYFLSTVKGSRIGKNVKISQSAKIVEPVYIGDNTIIGDYALVRESHIGNNCLIGGYCEVVRSYIGDEVMLHRNYIGDSVIDKKVLIGSGTTTANFRFDEGYIKDTNLKKLGAIIGKNCRIGVNSSLLPGVKIGKNTWIGPGEVIKNDIKDNIYVFNNETRVNKLT